MKTIKLLFEVGVILLLGMVLQQKWALINDKDIENMWIAISGLFSH